MNKKYTTHTKRNTYDCIVIGAGAAGLFYAAADSIRNSSLICPGKKLILEKTDRPGQKLLMSGNGMCNITHGGSIKDFISKYGDNGSRIRRCLYRHNNLELMKMMEALGVPLTERDDGKVFPASMKAGDVLDALLNVINFSEDFSDSDVSGWGIECDAEVTGMEILSVNDIIPGNDSTDNSCCTDSVIRLILKDGRTFDTLKLVIATGGASYPSTGSDGSFFKILERDLKLKVNALRPALSPVFVQDFSYSDLAGISFKDVIITCTEKTLHSSGSIDTRTSRGGLLVTHRGFSGPAALHISQHVRAGASLNIDFLPAVNADEMRSKLKNARGKSGQSITNFIAAEFGLPKAFVAEILCGLNSQSANPRTKKLSDISNKDIQTIIQLLKGHEYSVSGTGGWNDSMVTAGGAALDQIDLKTMRLATIAETTAPDIRIIGEALDINGDTGGYNLQFAYSSAMAALE